MQGKRELQAAEDAAWVELWAVLTSLDEERLERPGYAGAWSVRDLMAHLACWQAAAVHVLEQVRCGTHREQWYDVDELNDRFHRATRDVPLPLVRCALLAARTRMLEEWNALPAPDPVAEQWFRESGPGHYAGHLEPLREWVDELG